MKNGLYVKTESGSGEHTVLLNIFEVLMLCDECFGTGCNLCEDERGDDSIDAAQLAHQMRSCEKKKRYQRETDARMTIQRREKEAKIMLKAYSCDYCQGWHISKRIK